MANDFNVHSIIAAEAAAILEESCPFLMGVNRAREEDFKVNLNGFKVGSSITIHVPGVGSVYDGATLAGGGSVEDWQDKSVTLSISSHKHTALSITAADAVFKLDATDPRRVDYRNRVLKPQLSTLCAAIEADLLLQAVQATPNLVGTPGTTPTAFKTFGQARAKMQKYLAPASPRVSMISTDTNLELVDATKALFNPDADIAKQFREAYIGRAAQADWFECVNLPNITNGNDVTGVAVSGASQSGSSLLVSGVANGSTFKKGQVFTIAGVYAAHPLTGTAYGDLQQFVVTADTTATTTTVTLPIYPAITAAMPNKTVSATPADTAALTFVGSASTAYAQNLMFQRDAFTAAFVPPPIVAGTEGYVLRDNGISLAVQTGGSITALTSTTRVDVMYGFAAVRPLHACRTTQ